MHPLEGITLHNVHYRTLIVVRGEWANTEWWQTHDCARKPPPPGERTIIEHPSIPITLDMTADNVPANARWMPITSLRAKLSE